jgi:hypothetical protein
MTNASRTLRAGLALGVAAALGGLASSGGEAEPRSARGAGSDWTRLRRPLHLPTAPAGAPCPVSKGVRARTLSKDFGSALALGPGPVYPVVDTSPRTGAIPAQSVSGRKGFFTYKVLFITAPRYRGPVLVRGRRLDAGGGLSFGFSHGAPLAELRISGGGDGKAWRGFPSQSYVKKAGCYGYQADGFGFSRVVVARVQL